MAVTAYHRLEPTDYKLPLTSMEPSSLWRQESGMWGTQFKCLAAVYRFISESQWCAHDSAVEFIGGFFERSRKELHDEQCYTTGLV